MRNRNPTTVLRQRISPDLLPRTSTSPTRRKVKPTFSFLVLRTILMYLILVFVIIRLVLFVRLHNWRSGQRRSTQPLFALRPTNKTAAREINFRINYTCNDFFGMDKMVLNGTCLEHSNLKYYSCWIGPVIIDTSKIIGSVGGEPIQSVLDRPVAVEELNFTNGAIQIPNPSMIQSQMARLFDTVSEDLKDVLNSATPLAATPKQKDLALLLNTHPLETTLHQSPTTLLVRRGDYANPCMCLVTMYTVYMVIQKLQLEPWQTRIVWLDGHAHGALDGVWERLFGQPPIHIKQLASSLQFKNLHISSLETLVENALVVNTFSGFGNEFFYRYKSNNTCDPASSSILHFRNFVLERYNISPPQQNKHPTTTTKLLTFLVRKDYMAHPRSNGRTDRTIANLDEDVKFIQGKYPSHKVQVVSFEDMPFEQQLLQMVQTDKFVAVHGAGNIHVLFLPPHATFIEYVPKGFQGRKRFKYIAEWLNITYEPKFAWPEEYFEDGKISVRLRPRDMDPIEEGADDDVE
jgi:hypothetical protein